MRSLVDTEPVIVLRSFFKYIIVLPFTVCNRSKFVYKP